MAPDDRWIQVIDNSLVIADHVPGIRPPPRK